MPVRRSFKVERDREKVEVLYKDARVYTIVG